MVPLPLMVTEIISQLFGHSPNIHDIIIAVVSFAFAFILLPQLKDVWTGKISLNLYTSSLTTIGLIILTVNFFVMGFWISFAADFFNSVIWGLLYIFSYRNIKKK
jgi:TctA family transporter